MTVEKAKPTVTIELGGKVRTMRFSFGALATIEEKLGVNTLGGNFWSNLSATGVVTMLWAALKKDDPELTTEALGDMIDFTDLEPIMQKLKEALALASPAEKKGSSKGSDSGKQ
jgi:hypothetical protein